MSAEPRLAALALGLALAACGRVESAGEGGGAALLRNLQRARGVEISPQGGADPAACAELAERIARERGSACRVLAPGEAGDPRCARIAIGGPRSPALVALVESLGAGVGRGGDRPQFTIHGRAFAGSSDVLAAVVEDPERPGLPLTFLYANQPETLRSEYARLEPCWKPWLRVYRAGDLALEGPLAGTAGGSLVDVDGVRARELAGYVRWPARADGLQGRASRDVEPAQRDAYLDAVARARREAARWLGPKEDLRPLRLVLHGRVEGFAACATSAGLSSWNAGKNEIHALVVRDVPTDGGRAAARLLAEECLGPPSEVWLGDGAAVLGAGSWWGRGLEEWTAELRLGGLSPSVASLVDPRAAETNSPHAILPLRAALFRYLLESRGEAGVRGLWTGASRLAVDAELEKAFLAWLDDAAVAHRPAVEARRAGRRGALLGGAFLSGVGVEEPGRSPSRGFGSTAFLESLAQARAIGANAAALSCFAVAEPDPPAIPDLAGDAHAIEPIGGDAAVLAGLRQARASGMRTLLQPHLLTAPAGTLAGRGPQGQETSWKKFFDAYERFAVHAGLLAELAGADGLVLGGDLPESTGARDPGAGAQVTAWKRAGWGRVLGAARGSFSGAITWASGSIGEAKDLLFWSGLDAVACDLPPPLDGRPIPFDSRPGLEIERRVGGMIGELEAFARELGKPLLLTGVGFRAGGPSPGERLDAAYAGDPGLQAFELDAVERALRAPRQGTVLRGLFLWRWSSDPADAGVDGRDRLLRPGRAREAAARLIAGR